MERNCTTRTSSALLLKAAVGVLAMASASAVFAQADAAKDFPNRPLRIMGQGVGSTADYLSRVIGQKLTERWGQPVVVDNRAGAGGTIPTEVAARATPDGHTLVMGHAGPMVSAVTLYPKLGYDPVRDLQPISMVAQGVTALVVNTALPITSVKDLVAYARQKGRITYGSAGNGTISHLSGELFKKVAGIDMEHIPYKSAGFALTALMSGEVQVSFLSPVTVAGQLKAGGTAKIRPLAVSSPKRFIGAPDIPGSAEAGLPQFEARLWFGLFTTQKTPKPVVDKLHQAITEILNMPDVRETILKQGIEVVPSTPEALGAFVRDEIARWTPIIRAAGISAD
ncbi:MAG: tripartite tricarboxylate transporter substrate binding protein [Burkholderiales bacterium]|jgi:tripartite-type tricarboxylate transporter receptor subunit TctC|nr:tripartite tricarboxylate transporter substrate binding protein [Burkholderiales bacterium]